MIMSYKNISSNTINRHRTGGIIMTELSRFQKDVEVAASALEMRAENEDAREEAIHLYRKFGSTKQEPLRLAVGTAGIFSGGRCGGSGACGLRSVPEETDPPGSGTPDPGR